MNIREESKIEEIIEKIVTENKKKTLNEVKRMIENELRQANIECEIGIEEIIKVITTKKLLRKNKRERKASIENNQEEKKKRNAEKER